MASACGGAVSADGEEMAQVFGRYRGVVPRGLPCRAATAGYLFSTVAANDISVHWRPRHTARPLAVLSSKFTPRAVDGPVSKRMIVLGHSDPVGRVAVSSAPRTSVVGLSFAPDYPS